MSYPAWICAECGVKFGKMRVNHLCTFHEPHRDDPDDRCGWCGSRISSLTEPRDFGYPRFPGPQEKS